MIKLSNAHEILRRAMKLHYRKRRAINTYVKLTSSGELAPTTPHSGAIRKTAVAENNYLNPEIV